MVKAGTSTLAATELGNPRSRRLDQMTTRELLQVINREDRRVPLAVARQLGPIRRAVELIVKSIENGGRAIYIGAGTSGRLASLDAAECPPTFGVSPKLIQAVVAGGVRALTRAAEGAEDSPAAGAHDLAARHIGARDVVVGLTAGGGTPYVIGALKFARKRGANTVLVTSNRNSPARRFADIVVAPDTGPEVIAGSTRMKAGTAQKLILNMLSTAAMIRLGRVYNNWMVHLTMSNQKLRGRGLRILREASGASALEAERAFARAGNLRVALVMLKTGKSAAESRRWINESRGNFAEMLRAADSRRPPHESKRAASGRPESRKKT